MGFAALYIFVFNVVLEAFYHTCEGRPVFAYFVRIGFPGVDIFFFLSGNGLMHSMERNSLKTFYLHRLSRVYFPLLIGELIRMLLIFVTCVAGGLALWFVNGRIMKLVRKIR